MRVRGKALRKGEPVALRVWLIRLVRLRTVWGDTPTHAVLVEGKDSVLFWGESRKEEELKILRDVDWMQISSV